MGGKATSCFPCLYSLIQKPVGRASLAAPKTAAAFVHGTELPVIEYRGQRVVTLAMVDAVHQRPKDTARRNFNENRNRFVEGEDFFQTTPSELREHFVRTASDTPANKLVPIQGRGVTLLTESGYLMLVKSLTDDLAWAVQRDLVKAYFRVRAAEPVPAAPALPDFTGPAAALLDLAPGLGLMRPESLHGSVWVYLSGKRWLQLGGDAYAFGCN